LCTSRPDSSRLVSPSRQATRAVPSQFFPNLLQRVPYSPGNPPPPPLEFPARRPPGISAPRPRALPRAKPPNCCARPLQRAPVPSPGRSPPITVRSLCTARPASLEIRRRCCTSFRRCALLEFRRRAPVRFPRVKPPIAVCHPLISTRRGSC
jgi:hypothetical protein